MILTYQQQLHIERDSEKLRIDLAMAEAKGTARCTAGGVVAVKDLSTRGPSSALLDLPALRRLRDQVELAIRCQEEMIELEPVPETLRGSVLVTDDAPTAPFSCQP